MSKAPSSIAGSNVSDQLIETVCERLAADKRVRRTLPGLGRLNIDRQLPFLCVYRRPTKTPDAGTEQLVTSEASYLVAPGSRALAPSLARLVRAVASTLTQAFGSFLIMEIWAGEWEPDDVPIPAVPAAMRPRFRIVAPEDDLDEIVSTLQRALSRIKSAKQSAEVAIDRSARGWPKRFTPMLDPAEANRLGCHFLGLEVRPVYRNPSTQEPYPLVLRELERGLTRALRQAFYKYSCTRTTHCPVNYHVLGRRAMVRAVWEVDRRLATVSDAFDFLLQVTPVNAETAWRRFKSKKFSKAPTFHYRPLPVDPLMLKRALYDIPLERVEDPAIWQLLREKQDELDRRLTMLLDINTPRFVHGSAQLFGDVGDDLFRVARELLEVLPARARDDTRGGYLDAAAFSRRAEREIEHYREQWPEMNSRVRIRSDIAGGLMVSRGALLISRNVRIPKARVDALLAHEVGTHVVTYYNGRAQPFRQLYSGLAGYEPLQEGLAVLAEYLAGGLSRPRLRLLAARVVAARMLIDGASFMDTFRELDRTHDFEQRTAFTTTMRVYRGGGLTKDAVYLRGLIELLEYLGKGGKLEPLFVGKIAVNHIPIMRELQWRKVLAPPPLRPRYLDAPGAKERLQRVRAGLTLVQLIERKTR